MAMSFDDECRLLGLTLVAAQRVEFALYGIVAHAAHTPAAQKERRFRELTQETFLRGNTEELKATLGQLVEVFGDTLLIRTPELITFYKDRNLIAHDYVRAFRMGSRDAPARNDASEFLLDFLERALRWENILRGLLTELIQAAAQKEGWMSELALSTEDLSRTRIYREHVAKYLAARTQNDAV